MIKQLTFRSYNLSSPILNDQHQSEIENVYALFKRVYDEEYDIMYGEGTKATPEIFYINDEANVIFSGDKPIAFVLCRYANLALSAHYNQKWLAEWPVDVLDQLKVNSPEVTILNHLTVAPEFRRSRYADVNLGVMMVDLIATHMVVTGDELGLGAMRVNRGTPSLAAMIGARSLKQSHMVNGVEAELVALRLEDLSRYVKTLPTSITNMVTEGTYYGHQTTTRFIPRRNAINESGSNGIPMA